MPSYFSVDEMERKEGEREGEGGRRKTHWRHSSPFHHEIDAFFVTTNTGKRTTNQTNLKYVLTPTSGIDGRPSDRNQLLHFLLLSCSTLAKIVVLDDDCRMGDRTWPSVSPSVSGHCVICLSAYPFYFESSMGYQIRKKRMLSFSFGQWAK